MTLCMAVACTHEGEPRIVLCSDWREESQGIGSSEYTNKLNWVHDKWPALTAGTASQIEELLRCYRVHMKNAELTEFNYLDELKKPAHEFKAKLSDDYVRQVLGISYVELLRHGKEKLPDEVFRERISEISRIKIQAHLIVAGFLKGKAMGDIKSDLFPVICVVEDSDSHEEVVREEVHFASIGSGCYTSNAALYNRGANETMSLLPAIYCVWEAHRLSMNVPGVGEDISIDVLEPDGVLRELSDEGYDYCDFLWKKFGPREFQEKHKTLFDMKDDFLEKG